MSYDIDIADEEFNITWNVAPMFYDAIPEGGIRAIYGKTGTEALPILRVIRAHFEDNKEKLEAMEPPNGWGTFDNTYKCLCKMVRVSMNNPDEIWQGD